MKIFIIGNILTKIAQNEKKRPTKNPPAGGPILDLIWKFPCRWGEDYRKLGGGIYPPGFLDQGIKLALETHDLQFSELYNSFFEATKY